MKKKIENLDLLAGWEDEYCVPYIQVKEAGFYNVKIDDGLKGKTSEEFVAVEWNEAGYRCDIITGDLGSGKTLLLYRVAEKLLEKNNRMIFISARLSEEDNKESFRLLQVLASKKIKKRGKFVIIIDGLDELLDRGMSIKCKNLFEVASKYKATLLINCRQTLWKKLKEEYPDKVNKAWTTFKLDIKEDELNHKLNELKLSPEIVREIMQNPLLCFWIENMIKFNKVSTDRKRFSVLNDDYSFVKEAITRLQNNEEYKYDLDTNDWPDVRCFLQKIAVALWHYGEQKVSLAGCIDTADMEKYRKFICTSFMNEMLDMDLNKSKIGDVEICAFRYKFMEKFFLIEELCQQLKNNKYDILLRVDFFNEKLKSMRTAALKAMPADVKERVINMLKAEINKEDISGSVKAQMMAIIEELNITIAVV